MNFEDDLNNLPQLRCNFSRSALVASPVNRHGLFRFSRALETKIALVQFLLNFSSTGQFCHPLGSSEVSCGERINA